MEGEEESFFSVYIMLTEDNNLKNQHFLLSILFIYLIIKVGWVVMAPPRMMRCEEVLGCFRGVSLGSLSRVVVVITIMMV